MVEKSTGWSTSYYELPEDARELQDLIEHKGMNFAVGNMFKACYRLGDKEGTDANYDLNKIIWFATREKERRRQQEAEDQRMAEDQLEFDWHCQEESDRLQNETLEEINYVPGSLYKQG